MRSCSAPWRVCRGRPNEARSAAGKAADKFPQPNYITLKIAEEAGEVIRAAVHYAENRMECEELEGEIVQLLAMLNRIVPPTACRGGGDRP